MQATAPSAFIVHCAAAWAPNQLPTRPVASGSACSLSITLGNIRHSPATGDAREGGTAPALALAASAAGHPARLWASIGGDARVAIRFTRLARLYLLSCLRKTTEDTLHRKTALDQLSKMRIDVSSPSFT
jgi:hypothetical protein